MKKPRSTFPKNRPSNDRQLSRLEAADWLGIHPDTLTRNLPEGAASAVMIWGGHSKPMVFSAWMLTRWDLTRRCLERRHCSQCFGVMDDALGLGEHLMHVRHGCFESCGVDCCWLGNACLPCRYVNLSR
jgi:hypothetical protein